MGMLAELSRHANVLASELKQTRASQMETIDKCQEETQRRGKILEELHGLQQQQQISARSVAELQRWVAGRQRSRVKRLEAELSWGASTSFASSEANSLQSSSIRAEVAKSSSPSTPRGMPGTPR